MKGFTLIELLIVLVIVGVLATLGVSQYGRTVERSRQAEATSILGAMRGAQLRFAAENSGNYANTTIANLDIELRDSNNDGTGEGKFFNYTVPGAPSDADLADAARNGLQQTAGDANYQFRINRDGNITCQSAYCAGGP
jgi:prepilin-type N-terminal cleavage/methylation domain-containing protein